MAANELIRIEANLMIEIATAIAKAAKAGLEQAAIQALLERAAETVGEADEA